MRRSLPTLPLGHTLQARYHILRKIAAGGYGAVYLAEDIRLRGRRVAIKELSDVSSASRQLFKQEARVLAALDHPGLVHVSDFFEEGRSAYLVMDYIEGKDLLALAIDAEEENRLLPDAQVLQWMVEVCQAVAYLHRHTPPIIHRDIKPGNIRLDANGRAILVDFGIAKVGNRSKTQLMAKAVSEGFSPPEQYLDSLSTDTRSDIYALGASFYCLLTVTPPPDSLIRLTQQAALPPIRQYNDEISEEVEGLILTAMALHPEQRFEDAGDMLADLQQALGLAVTPLPPKPSSDHTISEPTSAPPARSESRCPHCGSPARAGARFCGKCGGPLQSGPRCPTCGAVNRAGAQFCAQCRTRLTSSKSTSRSAGEHVQEGYERQRAGRFQEAIQAYESALRLGATDSALYEHLAHCYLEIDAYRQAIARLENAIGRYPNNATLHIQLGIAYLQTGQSQEGLQAMAHAYQLRPQDRDLTMMLASAYMDAGRHAQALPILEGLVRRNPQDPKPRVQLAICCIILGKLQKAASLVKFLKRNQPDSTEIAFLQGMIDFKHGKSRQALRQFQSVVSQEPGHALAHYFIGEIYFNSEKWRRALQAYQMSARANPEDADAQASQCLCYLALGKQREARSALREALRIDPDNTLAQRIQHELKF